jgi:ribonuclease P protein component
MLPKKNRAGTKAVERIFKEGRSINSPLLTFKFIIKKGKDRKISFIAPKSVSKKAVDRNHLRRRGYAVLKNYLNEFPLGIIGIFVFKKYQDDTIVLENEIKNILAKIN